MGRRHTLSPFIASLSMLAVSTTEPTAPPLMAANVNRRGRRGLGLPRRPADQHFSDRCRRGTGAPRPVGFERELHGGRRGIADARAAAPEQHPHRRRTRGAAGLLVGAITTGRVGSNPITEIFAAPLSAGREDSTTTEPLRVWAGSTSSVSLRSVSAEPAR